MPPGYEYQASLPCCNNCDNCDVDYHRQSNTHYCEKHEVAVDEVGVCPDFS